MKHDSDGILPMANSGQNTNGCQFFINCAKADFLDCKHGVFGPIIDEILVMKKMDNVPTRLNNRPKMEVSISRCVQMLGTECLPSQFQSSVL